jgi:DNA-binding XRE family transcriptional regulator
MIYQSEAAECASTVEAGRFTPSIITALKVALFF